MIPRSTFQEVAATGLVAQPEFKSRISSLCQDSHPQKGEHEASFPARKAILTSSHTLNSGRGRGGKEQRKEGREGENTSIFFLSISMLYNLQTFLSYHGPLDAGCFFRPSKYSSENYSIWFPHQCTIGLFLIFMQWFLRTLYPFQRLLFGITPHFMLA